MTAHVCFIFTLLEPAFYYRTRLFNTQHQNCQLLGSVRTLGQQLVTTRLARCHIQQVAAEPNPVNMDAPENQELHRPVSQTSNKEDRHHTIKSDERERPCALHQSPTIRQAVYTFLNNVKVSYCY
jgi:hypothetical protein